MLDVSDRTDIPGGARLAPPHALVVEDDPNSLAALLALVEIEGFSTSGASGLGTAHAALAERPPDLVLTDLQLPDGSGLELIDAAAAVGAPVVLITGHGSVETAVEGLRRGVIDYLTKPIDLARLKTILANVGRTRELQAEIGSLRGELRKLGRFGPLIGASPAIGAVFDLIARVAPTDATVCIVGESGTGKELVAQAVHEMSRRRKARLVPVNCGAISPDLIESVLFGHERGSFTGADRLHHGVFEQASSGTLFLDEVAEMPVELQVKLLRVLETRTVTRVGGEQPVPVDVRVIAATNRIPEHALRDGRLREDLWYRLNVFPIQVPPLRERIGDIAVLAEHFLRTLNEAEGTTKRWSGSAQSALQRYEWPGNVRELKNLVHRAYILSDDEIDETCLPGPAGTAAAFLRDHPTHGAPPELGALSVRVGSSMADVEQQLVSITLRACEGNKQKAADMLGVSLKTLYNRLAEYRDMAGEPPRGRASTQI